MSNKSLNKSTHSLLLLSLICFSSIKADHDNEALNTNNGTSTIEVRDLGCHQDDPIENEELCTNKTNSKQAFITDPSTAFSLQIDIRPADCGSFYDDYLPMRRGLRIESAISTVPKFSQLIKTVNTFPVIDFIEGNTAHIVKSKDLTAKAYSLDKKASALYDSILEDAEEINSRVFNELEKNGSLQSTVKGKTTKIEQGQIDQIVLHIVIQSSIASKMQIDQIKLAKQSIYNRWGYNLQIIEIP